jgi:hypothetical protein
MSLSDLEKTVLSNQITTFAQTLLERMDTYNFVVWLTEMYFYRSMNDLLPEELVRARVVTKELEGMVRVLYTKYERASKGYELCSEVLERGGQ